jgi:hypothetical protein
MKTLKKGSPIQGDLRKLYEYCHLPGGGYIEALQLAEAHNLRNTLEVLLENQMIEINEVRKKIKYWIDSDRLNPPNTELPRIAPLLEDGEDVLRRHATTGKYEINVKFRMLGVQAEVDRPECFCNTIHFQLAAVKGKSKIFQPKEVPEHLKDGNFRRACFRAAQALQEAIDTACEQWLNFDNQVSKELQIVHNLPYYPTITTNTPMLRYVEE